MASKPPPSPRHGEVMLFRATLDYETDRGCALMAAAYLDSQLEELLKKSFVDDADVAPDVLGMMRPLGTFSSRIDSTYLLGHIGPKLRRDLHLIRRIRNEFGHKATPLDFKSEGIASRCLELYHSLREAGAPPRDHFTNAVLCMLAQIQGRIELQTHPTQADDYHITGEIKRQLKARVGGEDKV